MNLNDLIVGHYEGSLSAAEQAELQGLLSSSPDARHLFEQHGLIEGSMRNEAATIAPSHELRERTLAAAIAFAPQAIGGGALGWLSGKVAAAISAFVVGGVAIGIVVTNDDRSSTVNPPVQTPAVTAPVTSGSTVSEPSVSAAESSEQIIAEPNARVPNGSMTNSSNVAVDRSGSASSSIRTPADQAGNPSQVDNTTGPTEDPNPEPRMSIGDEVPVPMKDDTTATIRK